MQARMGNPAVVIPGSDAGAARPRHIAGQIRSVANPSGTRSICAPARSMAAASASTGIRASPGKQARPTSGCLPSAPGATRPILRDAERAALALTEAVTRVSDRADPVPDDIWDEATRHFDGKSLAALVIAIANINVWNRLNIATRQIAGEWKP